MMSLGTIEAWPAFAVAFTFVAIWTSLAGLESQIVLRIARRGIFRRKTSDKVGLASTLPSNAQAPTPSRSHHGGDQFGDTQQAGSRLLGVSAPESPEEPPTETATASSARGLSDSASPQAAGENPQGVDVSVLEAKLDFVTALDASELGDLPAQSKTPPRAVDSYVAPEREATAQAGATGTLRLRVTSRQAGSMEDGSESQVDELSLMTVPESRLGGTVIPGNHRRPSAAAVTDHSSARLPRSSVLTRRTATSSSAASQLPGAADVASFPAQPFSCDYPVGVIDSQQSQGEQLQASSSRACGTRLSSSSRRRISSLEFATPAHWRATGACDAGQTGLAPTHLAAAWAPAGGILDASAAAAEMSKVVTQSVSASGVEGHGVAATASASGVALGLSDPLAAAACGANSESVHSRPRAEPASDSLSEMTRTLPENHHDHSNASVRGSESEPTTALPSSGADKLLSERPALLEFDETNNSAPPTVAPSMPSHLQLLSDAAARLRRTPLRPLIRSPVLMTALLWQAGIAAMTV